MRHNPQRFILSTILCGFLIFWSCAKDQPAEPTPDQVPTLESLHADGRWIINSSGEKVILRGVNIPSLEWNSTGDQIVQSLIHMVDVWQINIARIPLSQDRWYGRASEQNDGGKSYRAIVANLIAYGNHNGCYIWLDLHWNNGGVWGENIGQHKMPDELSLTFWKDVAVLYANHPAVLFGLYNEPHDITWDVWRNGGIVEETITLESGTGKLSYRTPGHQKLLQTIRETGAENIVIAAGLDWGFDLRGIESGSALSGDNIAYDTHPYPWKPKPWDAYFGNVGRVHPIIVGEWGGTVEEGHQSYGMDMAGYLRRNFFCWTAWCLHPSAGPQLIKNWKYDPTWFGELVIRELSQPVILPD